MRLFLAIFPPKNYLDYFRDVLRSLDKEKRNLIPVNTELLHFTVRYIGSKVSPESKEIIVSSLREAEGKLPRPSISITGIQLGFQRQRDPRILMAQINDNDGISDLVNSLHQRIRNTRRKDVILWKPKDADDLHISIARLKPSATRSSGRNVKEILGKINIPLPDPFIPEEMYLVKSRVTTVGPVYTKLEKFKL